MPVDPDTQSLLDAMEKAGSRPLFDGSDPGGARKYYRTIALRIDSELEGMDTADITLDCGGWTTRARSYRPQATVPGTVLYFHGGGWVLGDLDTHNRFCSRIARDTGRVVISAEYRLAPEEPFPAAYEDCWKILSTIASNPAAFGGGPLAIAGDSAGGNLAAAISQKARDEGIELAAALLLYPSLDLDGEYLSRRENANRYRLTSTDLDAFEAAYVGASDRRDPRISPIYGVLAGVCPTIVAVAGFDPLRDEGVAYAEALQKAGVEVTVREYPTLIHGFFGMAAMSRASDTACSELTADLSRHLG